MIRPKWFRAMWSAEVGIAQDERRRADLARAHRQRRRHLLEDGLTVRYSRARPEYVVALVLVPAAVLAVSSGVVSMQVAAEVMFSAFLLGGLGVMCMADPLDPTELQVPALMLTPALDELVESALDLPDDQQDLIIDLAATRALYRPGVRWAHTRNTALVAAVANLGAGAARVARTARAEHRDPVVALVEAALAAH